MKWTILIALFCYINMAHGQAPQSNELQQIIARQKALFDRFFELSAGDNEELGPKTDLAMKIMETGVPSQYYRYARIWGEMLVNFEKLHDSTATKAEAFVNDYPDFAQAWFLHGEILRYLNNNDCVAKVQRCIELNPDLGIPYYFLADLYSTMNNPKLSVVYYDMLEKKMPLHKSLYYNRASEKTKLKDYAGAIEDYGKVKPGSSNYPKALFNRGYIYLSLKEYTKSEADFDSFLQLMPDYAAGYYYRGYCRYYTKSKEACCADMKTAQSKGYTDANTFLEKYCQ